MAEDSKEEWMRECSVCYTRGFEKEFITCEGCGAMVYCGKDCQQKDWDSGETTCSSYSHHNWCHHMKQYTAREQELSDLPFTFIKETTARSFHERQAVEFLKCHGVYGQGLWRRESPLLHKTQPVRKCGCFTDTKEDKWVSPSESSVLELPPATCVPPASDPLVSWQQYYVFRGLSLHSPVAAVLSSPLTLYYIITTCLRNDVPDVYKGLEGGGDFVVHMLGVEKEVEMKEAFLECARLLPGWKLHITMFGRQIAKSVDKYSWEKDNLCITVCRANYHESSVPSPHIAVGFNSGLPAYPTWPATLSKLKNEGTPAYFTDQSEYSCDCVSSAIGSLGIQGISPAVLNPFRSPLRIVAREHNMPWFSNAFLFCLLYGH